MKWVDTELGTTATPKRNSAEMVSASKPDITSNVLRRSNASLLIWSLALTHLLQDKMFVKEQGEGSVTAPIDIHVKLTGFRSSIWSSRLEYGVSTQSPDSVD